MASDFTTHYQLDKYVATDKPNLRDQYNAAMDKTDAALYAANQAATAAQADANAVSACLPSISFDSTNTVAVALANKADANLLPSSSFDSTNTVAAALANKADANLLPSSSFDSTNTVAAALGNKADANLLPTTAFDSVNTVKKYIDDKIAAITPQKRVILCFGDSYGTYVSDERGVWPQQLESRMGNKYIVKNYCVGGAAFANTGSIDAPYIMQQVTNAINDTSFDHSLVDFCVVVGGRNDGYRGTLEQSVQGVSDVGTALRTNFAHSKVVFGIGNWTGQKLTTGAYKFFNMQTKAKNIAGCVCTDGLWRALLTGDDSLAPQSTNYHPTPSGMWRITNLLIAAMTGGDAAPSSIYEFTNPFSNCSTVLVRISGTVTELIYTLSGQIASATEMSDAFNRVMPSIQEYASSVSVAAASGGGAGKGLSMRFNADGTVQTFPIDGATSQLPFHPVYII